MERAYWSQLTKSTSGHVSHETIVLDKTAIVGRGAEVVADVATAMAIGSVLFKEEGKFSYSSVFMVYLLCRVIANTTVFCMYIVNRYKTNQTIKRQFSYLN